MTSSPDSPTPSAAPRTTVVTGGTSGIGFQTALGLATAGDRVVITGRDRQRGEAALAELRERSGNDDVRLVLADLATVGGVHDLAEQIRSAHPKVDVLINNAGVMTDAPTATADGLDVNLAVNTVAPYLLTELLRDELAAASPSRVINITGGRPGAPIHIEALTDDDGFVPMGRYEATKRALESATVHQAAELVTSGIHANLIHPGAASTAMTRRLTFDSLHGYMKPLWPLMKRFFVRDDGGKSAAKAAAAPIWAATAPETIAESGAFFNKTKRSKLHRTVTDDATVHQVVSMIRTATGGA